MQKKTIKDYPVEGKRIFLRADFNVPLSEDRVVLDDTRIKAVLPTINYLLNRNAALVIASHLGRPEGKVVEKLRLDPVARRLEEAAQIKIHKVDEVAGSLVEEKAQSLKAGEAMLLENVRFHPGEEKNDEQLSRFYAGLAELFVNDAFGTAHRAHASTAGVGRYLPAVAGLLMEKELTYLGKILSDPPRPLVALLGGKKVGDKIGVIHTFVQKADYILVGGAMANTFMAAQGFNMGRSLVEKEKLEEARLIMKEAEQMDVKFLLPVDFVVAGELAEGAPSRVVAADNIPAGMMALDIGPKTIRLFADTADKSAMVVWNGPLGAFEMEPFHLGTLGVAQKIASSAAISLVGGGDTVSALQKAGLAGKMTHLSTGGGATLEFLEGKELPGIAVMQDIMPASHRV